MKTFSKYLTDFFTKYLCEEKGVSKHTLRSYGEAFSLLLTYFNDVKKIHADKIALCNITREEILMFLTWLETTRGCSVSTRNQRVASIHSFCKYVMYEDVTHLDQWNEILKIKFKKTIHTEMNYLSIEAVKILLELIPQDTREGRRDLALISLLYDSGARVQELCDLTPKSLHLISPEYITLFGKGSKSRNVPIQKELVAILKRYIEENHLDNPGMNMKALFFNKQGGHLTPAGVTYILNKYFERAKKNNPDLFPEKFSPHCMRHTKAMHLLRGGINLIYIRDILGHVQSSTTEVYARADSKQKREALEKAYSNVLPVPTSTASWDNDSELRNWLKGLGK